jgi:hypothetical protein
MRAALSFQPGRQLQQALRRRLERPHLRKWVSRPAGSTGIGPGDALFGSFVGLFVRQIGTADKTLRFRTQAITP